MGREDKGKNEAAGAREELSKRAVHGVECQLVTTNGKMVSAKYYIDRRLRTLRIVPSDSSRPEISGDLTRIRETYDIEAGSHLLPPSVRDALVEEQRRRLLLITFDAREADICILEATPAEREQTVMCM